MDKVSVRVKVRLQNEYEHLCRLSFIYFDVICINLHKKILQLYEIKKTTKPYQPSNKKIIR